MSPLAPDSPPQVRDELARRWGVPTHLESVRLHGGEESAAYRIGDVVARLGPSWRTTDELAWAYDIARQVAHSVPEALSPVPANDGSLVVRTAGRPLSVWPYVEAEWADPEESRQRVQAAELLARLHLTLSRTEARPRPASRSPGSPVDPVLTDLDLDAWLSDFHRRYPKRQLLHGDLGRANVLATKGRLVAVIDWDELSVGCPEADLAEVLWEWTRDREAFTFNEVAARAFLTVYGESGGTARQPSLAECANAIRDRIRREVSYSQAVGSWGTSDDPEDIAYEAGQLRAFRELADIT